MLISPLEKLKISTVSGFNIQTKHYRLYFCTSKKKYVVTVLNPSCFTSLCKCRYFFYNAN